MPWRDNSWAMVFMAFRSIQVEMKSTPNSFICVTSGAIPLGSP